jgi:hypothetical protein
MVAEVFAGLGALKTAFDIAKGLKDIDDATRRNAAVIELQEKILAAQQSQSSLIETARELEKEVVQLKAWEADKQRYELTALSTGIVAYALKPSMSNGEPAHYLCANCFASGKKSYLQQHIRGQYYDKFKCQGCGDELGIDKGNPPSRPDDYEDDWLSVRK